MKTDLAPIQVRRIDDPAEEIGAALRKAFPRAGIRAVGIGYRRKGEEQHLTGQRVIKIILRRKDPGLPPDQCIREPLLLEADFLGQKIRVCVPIDIEEASRAEATRYYVRVSQDQVLTASAYATWREGGRQRFGVVTAGHGLFVTPGGTALRDTVTLLTSQACGEDLVADVRLASHLKIDGLDVGLVLPPEGPKGGHNPCLRRIWKRVVVPDHSDLVDLLGKLNDQKDAASRFRHPQAFGEDLLTVAYFDTYKVSIKDWGYVTLRSVVETEGPAETFTPGTSGSGLVTNAYTKRALGIHAVCLDPEPKSVAGGSRWWTRSLGTSFPAARRWLSEKLDAPVRLFWDPAKAP